MILYNFCVIISIIIIIILIAIIIIIIIIIIIFIIVLWFNFGLGFIFYVFDNLMDFNLNMNTLQRQYNHYQGWKRKHMDDSWRRWEED